MIYDHYVQYFPDMVSYSQAQSHLASAFAVIREQSLVGVLFEVGFITNPHDRDFFKNDENLKKSAIPLDDAIEEYFLSLKDTQPATT
jgi:N-acetylmuramoyl-L-alanine amidase